MNIKQNETGVGVYYFYGKDRFLTKLEAHKKISELINQGFKKTVLENIDDLKQAIKSSSLFSEKKIFVFITEKLNDKDKKEFQKLIWPENKSLTFVFVEQELTLSLLFGRQKVSKIKTGEVDEKWLKNQAEEFNIEIDKTLTNYLLNQDLKSWDAGYFYFELLKLSLYKPGEKVNLVDLMKISENQEELNYFEWIRAVLEKQTARALKFIPENEYEALSRLKSLINIFELILVAEDSELTQNPSTVLRATQKEFLSRNSPYWVKNIRQWAGKMSYQQKLEALENLLDFEVGVKTGRLSSIEALKLFII